MRLWRWCIHALGDNAEALDDVRDEDNGANDVENKRGAVEEEVGLGRLEELDEEADEAD